MIEIKNSVARRQKKFFNQCVFHPTDAVEDAWGKRILDRMADDGAIDTVRIYAMLEDVVYTDEDGRLQYDFRINDLRLDYLISRGYNPVIAYAAVPDCISRTDSGRTTAAKNKTRYKGKMWNTNPPRDYKLWEEVCYEYTRHIVERYGEAVVAGWHIHCFNEPDIKMFFLSEIPSVNYEQRCEEYLLMYEAFVKGVRRACSSVRVGGPALAVHESFLRHFLTGVKERGLEINYISMHFYGTDPEFLNSGEQSLSVDWMMKRIGAKINVIKECGFEKTPILIDEWGACACGFYNVEECKMLMFRETEVYSAYFIRFIDRLLGLGLPLDGLMICLSGQHEMTKDFSGFRNFFTMNFIAKPIYNAFALVSRLYDNYLEYSACTSGVTLLPTRSDSGEYAIALAYADNEFSENIAPCTERITLEEGIIGKKVTVWCIDREHTNPYRVYERLGMSDTPGEDELRTLREEGRLKPLCEYVAVDNFIDINLTANSTLLITVK